MKRIAGKKVFALIVMVASVLNFTSCVSNDTKNTMENDVESKAEKEVKEFKKQNNKLLEDRVIKAKFHFITDGLTEKTYNDFKDALGENSESCDRYITNEVNFIPDDEFYQYKDEIREQMRFKYYLYRDVNADLIDSNLALGIVKNVNATSKDEFYCSIISKEAYYEALLCTMSTELFDEYCNRYKEMLDAEEKLLGITKEHKDYVIVLAKVIYDSTSTIVNEFQLISPNTYEYIEIEGVN